MSRITSVEHEITLYRVEITLYELEIITLYELAIIEFVCFTYLVLHPHFSTPHFRILYSFQNDFDVPPFQSALQLIALIPN